MKTIKSSSEISEIFNKGSKFSNRFLTLIVLQNKEDLKHDQHGRVAFIAGKKNGNAVWRNSAKRRMREICHSVGGPWENFDVIFLAKKPIMNESYSKVLQICKETIENTFRRMGF